MTQTHFQMVLFDKIKSQIEENHSLVDVVTDLLNVSKDSAYRRLRGETALSFDETVKLAKYFRISLSNIAGYTEDSAVFSRQSFIKTYEDFRDYMQRSLDQLKSIQKLKNHKMYYQAKDVPVYYQYAYPDLARFKIYVWLKSVYGIEKINGKYISMESITDELMDLAQQQWDVFTRINTAEIWNDTTVTSLLNQLEYYYEAALLESKEEALKICDQFKAMMVIIYKQALNSKRLYSAESDLFTAATYEMHFHEILLMDNHILVESGDNRFSYFMPYAGINYISTTDPGLTSDMKEYIVNQIKKSALISDVSEKDRNRFFIRIKNKIEQVREKIIATDPFL